MVRSARVMPLLNFDICTIVLYRFYSDLEFVRPILRHLAVQTDLGLEISGPLVLIVHTL